MTDDSTRRDGTAPLHGAAGLGRVPVDRAVTVLATAVTFGVLLVIFYYPVATVFADSVLREGRVVFSSFAAVFGDPFYVGDLAPLVAGEHGLVEGLRLWASRGFPSVRFGLFGFTTYQALLSTLASVLLGLPGAYVLSRYEFPGRRTVRSLTIVPFVLPSIMVAIGFVAMFGANGVFNRLLTALGLGTVDLVFTLEIIVLAHAFYNAPLVARLTTAAWEGVDASMVETARSLGASRTRAFFDVVAPQIYPSVLTGALLTFVFTFMSFPIVLALGGLELATVEVWIYSLVRNLEYREAATLAAVETVLSLVLTYAYLRFEARQAAIRGASRPPARKRFTDLPGTTGLSRTVAASERIAVAAYALVVVIVFVGPIASIIAASVIGPDGFTLRYYEFLLRRQTEGFAFQTKPLVAIENSLLFAAGAVVLAVPMGVTVAVVSTRSFRGRKVVDALAMAPLAVSGIVVGLGMLRGLVFGIEAFGTRWQVDGAVAIVAAHAVGGYPFVTRNVAPMLANVDRAIVETARSLGASRLRALLDVELPQVATGIAAGAAFAVAISIGEFDSTVILATGGASYTMPVAVQRYIGSRTLGPATAMGTVLLVVTSASFVVVDRVGGRWHRE